MMESILADFVEKIVELVKTEVKEIDGSFYSTKGMHYIEPHVDEPNSVGFSSLDSVVKMVVQDYTALPSPLFIHVAAHNLVEVFSDFAPESLSKVSFKRFRLCKAAFSDISISSDFIRTHEEAMIALRSLFIQNQGSEYLLDLLSSLTDENSVKTEDNGLSQTVSVKRGVALKERTTVKSRVPLRPYRTFFEVEQPESEFLVRILPENKIRILEADGGAWKMQAKENIKVYFEEKLAALIAEKKVIVMM